MRTYITGLLVFFILMIPGRLMSGTYYVSPLGDDSNPGTLGSPRKTIQSAISLLAPGDTLWLREGRYHEVVLISDLSGSPGAEIMISAYPGETVVLDGTIPIESHWELYQGNIYKTTIEEDIWQLFVEGRMQVVARWPNASTHPVDPISRQPGSWDASTGTWWSRSTTWANADAPATINGVVENNPAQFDLSATGKSFQGGTVILSVLEQGGDGNQERIITHHDTGSKTFQHPVLYPPNPDKAYRNKGKFYIIEHLEALDQEEEWYFIDSTNSLYLWAKEGSDPNILEVRGRNHSRAISLSNVKHIHVRGLNFFASNISVLGDYVTIEDCSFTYPDASKRLTGEYASTSSDASNSLGIYVNGAYFSLINCEFRFTEFNVLKVDNGTASRLENNLFYQISMLGMGKNGAIEQVNTYTRNSLITSGCRGAVKTNAGPLEGRNHTFNLFNGFGFMQVPDGAALQANVGNTPGANRSYNWYLNAPKYGSRWDGKPAGNGGVNHHSVGVLMRGTLQVKGDEHHNYNNSCFDSPTYNDIILLSDPEYGGNGGSYTFNNLADRMSGHRSEDLSSFPLPGTHGHNWNGYETGTDANLQVCDVENRDFRPRPGSGLVDEGQVIPGITDGYFGTAPDIGAYEFGDTLYWIPGRKTIQASSPVPANRGATYYEFVDLMWLEGYRSFSSDIYFGQSHAAVESAGHGSPEFKGNQFSNIFHPGFLSAGQSYFWRIDAVQKDSVLKGEVWSFTAGVDANPEVHTATIMVYGKKDGVVSPMEGAIILLGERITKTDADGRATITMLPEGGFRYSVSQKGYKSISDSVYFSSDTTLNDTLDHVTYTVNFELRDADSGIPIEGGEIKFNEFTLLTDQDGKGSLSDLEYKWYELSVSEDRYYPLDSHLVEVFSDTTLRLILKKEYLQVSVLLTDRTGGFPVNRASISYNDLMVLTNNSGKASLDMVSVGNLHYTIENEYYFKQTDSVLISGDTLLQIKLTPRLAHIQFEITGEDGALEGVQVELDGILSLYTGVNGIAEFINQLAREQHVYSIEKDGYDTISESFFLEVDTVVTVLLHRTTGFENSGTSDFRLYPNPASELLYLQTPHLSSEYAVISPDGKLVLNGKISGETKSIDLTGIPGGLYLMKVFSGKQECKRKFVIK